jgi:hypothetical protein
MNTLKAICVSLATGIIIGVICTILLTPKIDPKISVDPDVVPAKHEQIKQAHSNDDYIRAFNEPIVIARFLDNKNIYHITASDGWKSTSVQDQIKVTAAQTPRYLIQGDIGYALVGQKLIPVYSLGFNKFFINRITAGIKGTYSANSISLSIGCGFLIY